MKCPATVPQTFNFREPMFLVAYGYLVWQLGLVLLWLMVKHWYQTNPSPKGSDGGSDTKLDTKPNNRDPPPHLKFTFYRSSPLGTLLYYNLRCNMLLLFAVLGLMVTDNYGVLVGYPQFYLFYSSDQLSRCFVGVWTVTSAYIGLMYWLGVRVRDWCRIRLIRGEGVETVCVEQEKEKNVVFGGGEESKGRG